MFYLFSGENKSVWSQDDNYSPYSVYVYSFLLDVILDPQHSSQSYVLQLTTILSSVDEKFIKIKSIIFFYQWKMTQHGNKMMLYSVYIWMLIHHSKK